MGVCLAPLASGLCMSLSMFCLRTEKLSCLLPVCILVCLDGSDSHNVWAPNANSVMVSPSFSSFFKSPRYSPSFGLSSRNVLKIMLSVSK